jgi:hypothetical protein
MLHRLGCSVHILEQSPTHTPASHMADVSLGADALRFLDRYDRVAYIPLGIISETLQALTTTTPEIPKPFLRARRLITSWDALYFRLRANFDGLVSEYVPQPQPGVMGGESIEQCKARARFEINKQVVGIVETHYDEDEGVEKHIGESRVQVIVKGRFKLSIIDAYPAV